MGIAWCVEYLQFRDKSKPRVSVRHQSPAPRPCCHLAPLRSSLSAHSRAPPRHGCPAHALGHLSAQIIDTMRRFKVRPCAFLRFTPQQIDTMRRFKVRLGAGCGGAARGAVAEYPPERLPGEGRGSRGQRPPPRGVRNGLAGGVPGRSRGRAGRGALRAPLCLLVGSARPRDQGKPTLASPGARWRAVLVGVRRGPGRWVLEAGGRTGAGGATVRRSPGDGSSRARVSPRRAVRRRQPHSAGPPRPGGRAPCGRSAERAMGALWGSSCARDER